MAQLRDVSSGLPRFPGARMAWLAAAPLLILTLPASGEGADEAQTVTVEQAAPTAVVPISGAAVTQAAAIVTPAEARPESDDQQRRVLMLLLMNSAGPVRPYGNLGH